MGDLGGLLVGIAALLTAISGGLTLSARRSSKAAKEALQVSPIGMLEELRREVDLVLVAHQEIVERNTQERQGMERALTRHRTRAEAAETRNLRLQAEMAGLKMDLASARAEISDLRTRVDDFISHS